MGLAAKDVALSSVAFTGMMLHFCRHSACNLAGKKDRSIWHFCSPYFAKVHGYCFKTVRYSDSPLTISARSIGRL